MGVQAICGVNRAGSIQEHHGVGCGRIRDAAYLPRGAAAQVQGRVLQSEVGVDEIWAPSGLGNIWEQMFWVLQQSWFRYLIR